MWKSCRVPRLSPLFVLRHDEISYRGFEGAERYALRRDGAAGIGYVRAASHRGNGHSAGQRSAEDFAPVFLDGCGAVAPAQFDGMHSGWKRRGGVEFSAVA